MPTRLDQWFKKAASVEMNVDGSVTAAKFQVTHATLDFYVARILMIIEDATGWANNLFGGLAALTNGIKFQEVTSADVEVYDFLDDTTIKTIADLATIAEVRAVYDTGQDAMAIAAEIDLCAAKNENRLGGFHYPVKATNKLLLTVQDDLTGLVKMRAVAQGFVAPAAEIA